MSVLSRVSRSVRIAAFSSGLLAASGAAHAQTVALPAETATPESAAVDDVKPWEEKWLKFSNSWVTAKWGWMIILDGAGFTQDDASKKQVGDLPAIVEPRADRLILGGTLRFPKPWKYLIGANYNGLDAERGEKFSWLDLALDIPVNSWLGSVNIGRQKIGVAQEWMSPGTEMFFMERSSMDLSFAPQRNIGIKLHNAFANGRATYNVGIFNDWFVNDRSLSANGTQYAGRFTFLPLDRNEGKTIVSVATSVYYKPKTDGTLKFRSRPEVNQSPYFADTGSFQANHSTSTQFEVLGMNGPTTVFADLTLTPVDAPAVGDPFFHGGYVGASYVLTGEQRPYSRTGGYYGALRPDSPFSFSNGGLGAWEVSTRYTYLDLTDGAVDGGVLKRITGAVSWYPNDYWRFEFNYGHGVLDRDGASGHFNVVQARIQVGF